MVVTWNWCARESPRVKAARAMSVTCCWRVSSLYRVARITAVSRIERATAKDFTESIPIYWTRLVGNGVDLINVRSVAARHARTKRPD